jgi:HNH endonuclease
VRLGRAAARRGRPAAGLRRRRQPRLVARHLGGAAWQDLPDGLAARLRAAVAMLPPALGGAPSQLLDLGRSARVVSAAQRAVLALRDGGCVVPGCDPPVAWCEAHHLRHWLSGGPTDLANLVLVCRAHHRAAHEGGWTIRHDADGHLTVTPPQRRPPLGREPPARAAPHPAARPM